jgi:hypothetical protein
MENPRTLHELFELCGDMIKPRYVAVASIGEFFVAVRN